MSKQRSAAGAELVPAVPEATAWPTAIERRRGVRFASRQDQPVPAEVPGVSEKAGGGPRISFVIPGLDEADSSPW